MKKLTALFLSLILVFSLTACSGGEMPTVNSATQNENTTNQSSITVTENSLEGDTDVLVVYFSQPETKNASNMTEAEDDSVVVIDGEVLGNTQYAAYVIRENTKADLFRIEPETPYTTNHQMLTAIAKQEQENNARPALKEKLDNLDKYKTVFIGYPIWWGDMPMVLYSFFDEHDLSGKTIVPFNTHGGSGFADTVSAIKELEPNADVSDKGKSISRDDIEKAGPEIVKWLKELGY